MIDAIETFWRDRSSRERKVICASALALALAYAYAWLPVTRERERLIETVPHQRIAAREMEREARELQRLRSAARPAASDLKSAIVQAAAASAIALAPEDVVPHGAERVRVAIPAMRLPQWLDWIARLQSSHRVQLETARLVMLGDGDRAKIEAVFVRAAQ